MEALTRLVVVIPSLECRSLQPTMSFGERFLESNRTPDAWSEDIGAMPFGGRRISAEVSLASSERQILTAFFVLWSILLGWTS